MSDLTDIRKEVQQFAEVISQALHVESEIIDEKYEVVGSTSFVFQGERNDWSDSNSKICRHVFESRRPLILSDPGENQLCSDCAEKGCCFLQGRHILSHSFRGTLPRHHQSGSLYTGAKGTTS